MSTNSIYPTTPTRLVNEASTRQEETDKEFSLSYKYDEDYQSFVLLVQELSNQHFDFSIATKLLYRIWFRTRYFIAHWKVPTKRADASMLWSMFNSGFTKQEGAAVIFAWWRKHNCNVSDQQFEEWKMQTLDPKWQQSQPRIQKHQEKKMAKQQSKLYNRITAELENGRSTPKQLSQDLQTTADAVQWQLQRLVREGKVLKHSWGLYSLV
jgi:hypothetical protein